MHGDSLLFCSFNNSLVTFEFWQFDYNVAQ